MADPKDKPPAKPGPAASERANADWNDEEGEEWRHPPVAPKDEGPLDSLGKSISDVVTGPKAP